MCAIYSGRVVREARLGRALNLQRCHCDGLAVEQFDSLLEAQVLLEDWRIEYNTKRPHSSLGWLAPAACAERWEAQLHAGLS